jgi:hypothetical protein
MFNKPNDGEYRYVIQVMTGAGGITGTISSNLSKFEEFAERMHDKISKGQTIAFMPGDDVCIVIKPGPNTAIMFMTFEHFQISQKRNEIATAGKQQIIM